MKVCEHGNKIDPPGINCLICMSGQYQPSDLPAEVRQEFLEQALAYILRQSMHDAGGNQTLGVAVALKRAWLAGFKTGQSCPAKLH